MEDQLPMSYADHEAPEAAAEYLSSALMTPENMMLPYDYQSFISSELFRHICLAVSSSSSSQMVDSEANSSDAPAAAVMATDDGLADDYQAQADHPIPESDNETDVLVIKCKILHHPLFPRLLRAYVDCQKFTGGPSEAGFADEIEPWDEDISAVLGSDPQLDEFMETYCEILEKHNEDLCSTISSVTSFLNTTEMQLADLCGALLMTSISENVYEDAEEGIIPSPEEEQPAAGADDDQTSKCSTKAKSDLKMNLLSKYGCAQVSNLKLEFSNRVKKKKGKLPCRSRQVLVNWWNSHPSWPYPSEADKVELTGMTGLLPKQINNWFINQRKRHWRAPAESLRYSWIDNNLSAGTGSGKTND